MIHAKIKKKKRNGQTNNSIDLFVKNEVLIYSNYTSMRALVLMYYGYPRVCGFPNNCGTVVGRKSVVLKYTTDQRIVFLSRMSYLLRKITNTIAVDRCSEFTKAISGWGYYSGPTEHGCVCVPVYCNVFKYSLKIRFSGETTYHVSKVDRATHVQRTRYDTTNSICHVSCVFLSHTYTAFSSVRGPEWPKIYGGPVSLLTLNTILWRMSRTIDSSRLQWRKKKTRKTFLSLSFESFPGSIVLSHGLESLMTVCTTR